MSAAPMKTCLLAIVLVGASPHDARSEEGAHRLRGLFCNTEEQIDATLSHMRRNLAIEAAVGLTNRHEIVCTYADKVEYMVRQPLIIGLAPGLVPLVKYEATLVGVVVGGNVRPVDPPARIFFVAPARLAGASVQGGA